MQINLHGLLQILEFKKNAKGTHVIDRLSLQPVLFGTLPGETHYGVSPCGSCQETVF